MAKAKILTAEEIRQLLDYDPLTGVLTWRWREETHQRVRTWNTKYAGKKAGSVGQNGYKIISIGGWPYRFHRIIWLWMTGAFPENEIDHIDLDKQNNVWANLRLADPSKNGANKALFPHNSSGFKGVRKRKNKWVAEIMKAGKQRHLGCYSTPEEAHAAYCEAAKEIHGEFARFS